MSRKKENDSEFVRVGSVSILLYPWRHPSGRQYWRFVWHDPETGRRKYATRADYKDAKKAARDKAVELANGSVDFTKLTDQQRRAITRLLAADATLANVEEFLVWQAQRKSRKTVADAATEFMAQKRANRGASMQNVATLDKILAAFVAEFEGRELGSLTVDELQAFIQRPKRDGQPASPRTRHNTRRGLVTFFRWCRTRKWLPFGPTAAEDTDKPIVPRQIPETYTPAELATMLAAVRPEYLPWLATAAFAGVRTEEIAPDDGGEKSPLDWSDFHWKRGLLIVRPETAKTKHRRVVPIQPALRAWLEPIHQKSGPICSVSPPARKVAGRGEETETKRLGALVGGWRKNALRHSFISYRAALVGLGQTAMEAGNSESEAKRSYNDAKGPDEAEHWFGVTPDADQPRNTKRKSLKINK